jgi:hypothetical protein
MQQQQQQQQHHEHAPHKADGTKGMKASEGMQPADGLQML